MRQLVALVFLLATAAIRTGAEELVQAEPAIYRTNDAVESNDIRRLLEAKRPCGKYTTSTMVFSHPDQSCRTQMSWYWMLHHVREVLPRYIININPRPINIYFVFKIVDGGCCPRL